jgi:hypothetical protein
VRSFVVTATKVGKVRELEVIMSKKVTLSEAELSQLSWLKALCSSVNGQCVELAAAVDKVAIRDSKDPNGPILVYTSAEFSAFLEGARNGEFDHLVH